MTSASTTAADAVFEGVYGPYRITDGDRREVLGYRLALFTAALAQAALLLQWQRWGGTWLWPWLLPLLAGVGLALRWIHIYLRPLHRALQLLWLCLGLGVMVLVSQGAHGAG